MDDGVALKIDRIDSAMVLFRSDTQESEQDDGPVSSGGDWRPRSQPVLTLGWTGISRCHRFRKKLMPWPAGNMITVGRRGGRPAVVPAADPLAWPAGQCWALVLRWLRSSRWLSSKF